MCVSSTPPHTTPNPAARDGIARGQLPKARDLAKRDKEKLARELLREQAEDEDGVRAPPHHLLFTLPRCAYYM